MEKNKDGSKRDVAVVRQGLPHRQAQVGRIVESVRPTFNAKHGSCSGGSPVFKDAQALGQSKQVPHPWVVEHANPGIGLVGKEISQTLHEMRELVSEFGVIGEAPTNVRAMGKSYGECAI